MKALLSSLLCLFVHLSFGQNAWYTVRDSLYQIHFPAKPFMQEGKDLKEGKTRTLQMDYRDYRMNYLFLIRTDDSLKLDDRTVRVSALIRNIAEICVSLNYSLDKPKAVKALFRHFQTLDSLPYPAMEAKYYAQSAASRLTMRAQAFFIGRRMYLAVVYSQGDRLFDLKNANRFFNSLVFLRPKAPARDRTPGRASSTGSGK